MDLNHKGRLKAVLDSIEASNGKMTGEQARELFNLHNEMFPKHKETGTHCHGCRSRVYERMKREYKKLTANDATPEGA